MNIHTTSKWKIFLSQALVRNHKHEANDELAFSKDVMLDYTRIS